MNLFFKHLYTGGFWASSILLRIILAVTFLNILKKNKIETNL
jgi:hypothetical protein